MPICVIYLHSCRHRGSVPHSNNCGRDLRKLMKEVLLHKFLPPACFAQLVSIERRVLLLSNQLMHSTVEIIAAVHDNCAALRVTM